MRKIHASIFMICFLLTACQTDKKNPFLISKTHVGTLTKDIEVRQLDSIFKNDSIVIRKQKGMFGSRNEIIIYDKNGNKLLLLNPVQNFDSTSNIGNIQIIDPRFKTQAGFGVESTFKDLVANYTISRIENTLNAIVIFIDEINAYVTIDKKDLPGTLYGTTNQHIEVSQIPETAKIHYFWIGWQ